MGGKNSKKFLLKSTLSALFLACSLHLALSQNYEVSLESTDVWASSQTTAALSGSCSDPAVTAYAMDGDYTITWNITAGSAPTCSATLGMPGGQVNGDTIPTPNCDAFNDQPGFVVIQHRQPTMKLSGLVCQTQDRSKLEINGDGSDNTKFDVALNTTSANNWNGANKVDASTSSSKITLVGTSGLIGTAALVDGSDNDDLTNGEVEFGGVTPSKGASKVFLKVDATNYDVQNTTDQETLTYTFTAQ